MPTLFQITEAFKAIYDRVDESGEIGTQDAAELAAFMDDVARQETVKLDSYIAVIKQLECEESAALDEADQWKQKALSRSRRIEWLKSRLKQHLEETGRTRIETESGRVIAIQKNGGALPVVLAEGIDGYNVPLEYAKREVDKEAVARDLKAGHELEFAKLGERGTHLRIK